MTTQNINAQQAFDWLKAGEALLLDVREPDEFKAEHIIYAQSVPLSAVDETISKIEFPKGKKIIMQCLGGVRGAKACAIAAKSNLGHEFFNIENGLNGWKDAGLPVTGSAQKISIFRQVQMVVGSLVMLSVLTGFAGFQAGFVIAGIFGAALALSGVTGWCGLAMLLQKMPWNKISC